MERHLVLQELSLRPAGEWTPGDGWTVVRIIEGAGYCLQSDVVRELNSGDMVIVGSHAAATFRASQLGVLRLEFFLVLPQCLNGLLTITECRQLEGASGQAAMCLLCYPASDTTAQKFTRIAAQSQREGLAARSALFQLWAGGIARLLSTPNATSAVGDLRERFRQAVGKMSEMELATLSLPQLAEKLHCSERHFSRLFHGEFHVSLRKRQMELRLQRARQLLEESDAKIINVAYESGYRHLGLFNIMFKRRFGVTPSQWRQKNPPAQPKSLFKRATPVLAVWLLLAAHFFFSSVALAQTNSLAANHMNTSTNAGPHFKVEKYLVDGNTVLAPGQLGQILTNLPAAFGTNVSFADIRAALADLQMAYRERGYVTVSVGLPQQKLTNAMVKIKVTEGRIADIKVQGNNHYSTKNVLRALPSLHTNMLLNSHVFQRELDLANANRDRQVYPVISPGPDAGTTELTLKVKDRLPLHARVEINNVATPGTPDSRVVFNSQYNNLWQLEHQFGLSYSFTPVNFRGPGDFYISPLDLPLIANYSAYYRLPLGPAKSVQQQIDASGGRFGYNEVTHQFQMPPPSGRPELTIYASRSTSDTGIKTSNFTNIIRTPLISIDSEQAGQNVTLNEGFGAKVSWPLPRMGNLASTLLIGMDLKHYEQISYNTNSFIATTSITNGNGSVSNITTAINSAQPVHTTEIYYLPLNVGFNATLPDPWGSTFLNAQANFNLSTFGGYSRFQNVQNGTNHIVIARGGLSQVAGSTNVHDGYITVQFGAERLQRIYKDWTVKIHADGQWANGRLFSNEQFGMGGNTGVRGYSDGQAYGDAGWRVSIEPQMPLINIGMVDGNVPFWLRSSVFMDYGRLYLFDGGFFSKSAYANGPPIGPISGNPHMQDFWGTGWSLTANIGNHFDGRLTVAFPLANPGVVRGWSPVQDMHVYFAVGAQF